MNERIRELIAEADRKCSETRGIYDEILAELIIQDCMDVVDGYTKPRTFDTHYDAVAQIEQLFGIKHNGVEE